MWSLANAGMDGTATGKGRGALGLSLVSVKARGKETEKHIDRGVCKEYGEAY